MMEFFDYLFILLELIQELLVVVILITFVYACVEMVRASRQGFKEIDLISKRFEILMGMPLKKAREILKGNEKE